jgi:hypothetical protein
MLHRHGDGSGRWALAVRSYVNNLLYAKRKGQQPFPRRNHAVIGGTPIKAVLDWEKQCTEKLK